MSDMSKTPTEKSISFDIVSFLWQKKFRIAFTAILMFSLGAYYVIKLPKVYTARSTLLMGYNENKFKFAQDGTTATAATENKMDTHIEFIRSRQFAEIIVRQHNLIDEVGFSPAHSLSSEDEKVEYAIDVLKRHLTLVKVGTTDMLRVGFDSTSPQVASKVANYIGPAFFEFQLKKGRDRALNASKWLNEQIDIIQGQLDQAEQELLQFFTENKIVDIDSEMEIVRIQISALKQEKIYSDRTITDLKAAVAQVEAAGNDESLLLKVPWVLRNAQVIEAGRLIVNEQQLFTEISKRYKYKHQKYIAAKARVDELEARKRQVLKKVLVGLKRDHATALKRESEIVAQIHEAEEQHRKLGFHETQLSKLQRQVEATQKLYEVFLSRLQETEILKDLGDQDEFSVVDYATTPQFPSKPKVMLMLFVLMLLSLIVSVGGWLFLHLISDRKTRFTQLLHGIEVPVLAEIPKLSKLKKGDLFPKAFNEGRIGYEFSEAIRNIRTSVLVRDQDGLQSRVIALSEVAHTGNMLSLSVSLAESFANLEKSLLMDVNLRQPGVAASYGLKPKRPGITSFVAGKSTFSECVSRSPGSTLGVMPSGPIPPDPQVYLSKPRFANIVRKLSVIYERVIVEVPPVNEFSDALMVSKLVDGLILVVDIESTESADILEAVQRLKSADAPILGAVLLNVKHVTGMRPKQSKFRKLMKVILRY